MVEVIGGREGVSTWRRGIKPTGKHGALAPPKDHEAAVKTRRKKDTEKGDIFPEKSGS